MKKEKHCLFAIKMASSKETYCLCGQPYNIGQFMIECDCCREWFHGSCVDVKIYHSDDIDKYHCPKCAQTYGPSVLKIPTNNHRADRYELGAETRPSQVGTPAWVRALAARPLRPVPAALHRMRAHHFNEEFVRDDGFTRPVIFHSSDGLEMKVPNAATFTVRSVLRFCGAQLEVEVIDVRKQSTLRMPLGDFVDYFETPPEHRDEKVLNVLSLEFSDTNMAPLVEPPIAARRLDWAERAWPAASGKPRPAVQKYCLMSPAGAYTDFHVDFGGTTVWYHVLHGRKIFYLVPPTATNLALYQQWSASNNQNERFFGDMVEWYGTAELCAGQSLFIPGGWLHAVLTPADSLVFGGNFLHSYAIEMQLQVYEIERRAETPAGLRYPLFEPMHWYAGATLLTMLRRHNEETQDEEFTLKESNLSAAPAPLAPLLLRGIKLLAAALKDWHALKPTDAAKRDSVPKCLNSGQLVRELCKELRTLEKRSATAATKDKDFKIKNNTSPTKAASRKPNKKLKLTLPKPIMHMAHAVEQEKVYADKLYYDNKEVVYSDARYITQDIKYANGVPPKAEGKEAERLAYAPYDEPYDYDRQDRKQVLKVKMNNSPSSSRDEAPPPYGVEHSILKSHLIRNDRPALKPIHQWTISKKDIGDYHEEQVLFTNEHLHGMRLDQHEISYGPGMYSAEDIQPDYQYSEAAKPGSYQPEYGYQEPYDTYQRYDEHHMQQNVHQQGATYSVPTVATVETVVPTTVVPTTVGAVGAVGAIGAVGVDSVEAGFAPLPSYDAAVAAQAHHQYEPAVPYSPEPKAVRRSERPVRRRVSNTYDYEDGDLYIDDAPAPRRRKPAKHKHHAGGSNAYRSSGGSAGAARPANGIESLIQASVLAEEEQPATATEDAAVAGMLSISERYAAPPRTFGLASDTPHAPPQTHDSGTPTSSKRTRKPPAAASSADEDLADEEDVIKEVHRDEEYVYPSLEMSSDEDEEWTSSRRRRNSRNRVDSKSKGEKDECWSPRARVGRVAPRLRHPARAGVRRECVRAALTAAAAAASAAAASPAAGPAVQCVRIVPLDSDPRLGYDTQRAYYAALTAGTAAAATAAATSPAAAPAPQNAKRAVLATKSRRPPPPVPTTPNNKNLRLKKGMKTAKQRLGKILKIHKMIY